MPKALTPLSLTYIGSWENSPFLLLALWGNKNGLPSMKRKELENFQNKSGLKGCKWSSLNAPGTETPQSHAYWERVILPTPIISPLGLWGNKNWLPSMKWEKLKIFQNKMGLKGCKWSSLNAPGTETPQSHPYWELGEFPFSIISPLG